MLVPEPAGEEHVTNTRENDIEEVKDFSVFNEGVYSGSVLRETKIPHGQGRMFYNESDEVRFYDGEFRHGNWHGYGCLMYRNGDSYVGEFAFEQQEGQGLYHWYDGRLYEGEFRMDQRHGKGTFTWPDGACYVGDFDEGQRTGQGKYTFAEGSSYEGSWLDGKYHGQGTFKWSDGRSYSGSWHNGQKRGYGIELRADGSVEYEGEFPHTHRPVPPQDSSKPSQDHGCSDDDEMKREKGFEKFRSKRRLKCEKVDNPAASLKKEISRAHLRRELSSATLKRQTSIRLLSKGEEPAAPPLEKTKDNSEITTGDLPASSFHSSSRDLFERQQSISALSAHGESMSSIPELSAQEIYDSIVPPSLLEVFPTVESLKDFFPNEESLHEFFPTDEAFQAVLPIWERVMKLRIQKHDGVTFCQ